MYNWFLECQLQLMFKQDGETAIKKALQTYSTEEGKLQAIRMIFNDVSIIIIIYNNNNYIIILYFMIDIINWSL